MKKYASFLLGSILFLCVFSSNVLADDNANTPPIPKNNTTFLQQADTAVLSQSADRPGYYVLTLYGVSPYMTYFSTMPFHSSGILLTQDFMGTWFLGDKGAQQNNPNAVIFGSQLNGEINQNAEIPLLTLSNPKSNASKTTIQYVAKSLSANSLNLKEFRYDHAILVITS